MIKGTHPEIAAMLVANRGKKRYMRATLMLYISGWSTAFVLCFVSQGAFGHEIGHSAVSRSRDEAWLHHPRLPNERACSFNREWVCRSMSDSPNGGNQAIQVLLDLPTSEQA